MFFKGSTWLWVCLGTGMVLGSALSGPGQQRQNLCFQLHRFHCTFEEAGNYCSAQGGLLAYTWNQEVQELIQDFLERGKKWWVGQNLTLPGKHHKEDKPAGATTHHATKPSGCTYLFRNANQVSSKEALCSQGHYFICQTDAFSDQGDSYKRHGNNSHLLWRPKKTREVTKPGYKMTRGVPFQSTCHQPAHANLSKTLCHSLTPLPSIPPTATTQVVSVISVPTRPPLPGLAESITPTAVMQAGQPLEVITSSPVQDSFSDVLATLLQGSLQNVSDQVIDEIARNFSRAIHGLQVHSKLQKACKVLQKLTASFPRFSESAQVSVINSLIYLSEQLLRSPFQNNSDAPTTVCLFHSLSSIMEAGKASQQRSELGSAAAGDVLNMPLLALGKIQEAFLQQIWLSESSVTLTSSVATLMLSSQNTSALPQSSYTLGQPAPVRVGFPSASALEALLNKHPGVNVQVTGLAFNPFRDFDDKNIVGSIGSVQLSSSNKLLKIHDLMEDIEIMLWRNASMEIHSTTVNVSTDHFVITVNVTSPEKTLIVCIEPENPLLMTLYLGFQYQPNQTYFHLNITLPKDEVWQKDEEYTWVLTPKSLRYGTGTYYITAVLDRSQEHAGPAPTSFSVVTAVTQCYFWDDHNNSWESEGCQVGPQSTFWRTQCLCNHLTYFGSDFFVVPRTVDMGDTIRLLLRVTNNPVGVSLLASLFGFYMLILVWAQRKDQTDTQKVKVTVLADNDPSSQFHYLLQVYTGYRRKAATTAKVVVTLYGSEGRSAPHHLCDPQKAVFERGALDVFLLRTQSSLGELHSLRLWHDNSGVSPAWYVNQVVVMDVDTHRKWHFLCRCWLAVDLGDCERDRVFMPVTNKELFSFRHLFSSMVVEKFTQDYLWLSVATRHPWNPFTRVQRLSCCATLLLCNMLINIMFWRMNGPAAAGREEQVGPFAVTWSELRISIQTALILFPINLVIGQLFQLIQSREPLPQFPRTQAACLSDASLEPLSHIQVVEELKETVGFLLRRKEHVLSGWERSSWLSSDIHKLVKLLCSLIHTHLELPGYHQQAEPCWAIGQGAPENHRHFCCYLHSVLQRVQCYLSTRGPPQADQPCDFLDAAGQLQKLQELLGKHTQPAELSSSREATSSPVLGPEAAKTCRSPGLPNWLAYLCWLLLGVTNLAAAFFTALYSLELNKDEATSWVVSLVFSVLQNVFVSQPVRVLSLAALSSLMLSRMPRLTKEKEQQTKRILALLAKCTSSPHGSRDVNNPIYIAPAIGSSVKCPGRTVKQKKLLKQIADIWVQILFLILLMTTIYSAKNSNRFYLHQAIWKRFSHGFSEIKLLKHFYLWANHTLLPNLYGDYRGFITDGNSFLLGNVLLRQIRMPGPLLFPTRVSPQEQGKPSHLDWEDTKNYGVRWGPPETNISASDSIWHYQSPEIVGSSPVQGEFATYSGGGYVVRLGRNASTALGMLRHLEQNHWLDHCTRSLFVEFVVFNANVDLFCAVTLVVESSSVGAFFTSVRLDSLTSLQTNKKDFTWSVISQVIYYLLACYYAFTQGHQLKQQRWRFFTRKRNVLDMSIILISFILLGLNTKLISLLTRNMAQYHSDPDRFISFHEVVRVNSAVTYLVGFLVLLATLQLWSLFHHHPRLQVIGRTLSRSWDEVVGFLLVLLILLTGYAIAFNLLFGWSISDYRTFSSSAVTVVGLLTGLAEHEEVIALNPVLGAFLILTSVILMVLVVINLLVSVILMTFGKERQSLKTRKEATLLSTLLEKLSSLLGIQRNRTP